MSKTTRNRTPDEDSQLNILNPRCLVAAITGRWPKPYKCGMPRRQEAEDSNRDCLWRRLQCCILLSGVQPGADENSVKRFCESVISGKRTARNYEESSSEAMVVDAFRCYGSGHSEGYADTSDDEENLEEDENPSKVQEESFRHQNLRRKSFPGGDERYNCSRYSRRSYLSICESRNGAVSDGLESQNCDSLEKFFLSGGLAFQRWLNMQAN